MREETIKTAINNTVESFILWQRSKLGRDVEPAQLYYMLRAAGAEHITVTAPVFTPVNAASIATAGVSRRTGGLEININNIRADCFS